MVKSDDGDRMGFEYRGKEEGASALSFFVQYFFFKVMLHCTLPEQSGRRGLMADFLTRFKGVKPSDWAFLVFAPGNPLLELVNAMNVIIKYGGGYPKIRPVDIDINHPKKGEALIEFDWKQESGEKVKVVVWLTGDNIVVTSTIDNCYMLPRIGSLVFTMEPSSWESLLANAHKQFNE